jgi:hypothetical protein
LSSFDRLRDGSGGICSRHGQELLTQNGGHRRRGGGKRGVDVPACGAISLDTDVQAQQCTR